MVETTNSWETQLSLVLNIIENNPEKIVDDTYIEKLITWLTTVAFDEKQRDVLMNPTTNILNFLSSPSETLLSTPVCANFSLRLAGILAGSSSVICEVLIEHRILQNLFGNFEHYKSTFFKHAVIRCSFFEGLSSLLGNIRGYSWILETKGFVTYATKLLTDSSFYVTKSAIKFLKRLLLTAVNFGTVRDAKLKDNILQIISAEYAMSELVDKPNYLDLTSQLFDGDAVIAIELLDSFGGLQSILQNCQMDTKFLKVLPPITEICCKLLFKRSEMDFTERLKTIDKILKVSIQIANIDIVHLFYHLTQMMQHESSMEMNELQCWIESLLHIVMWSVLKGHFHEIKNPKRWLCEQAHHDKKHFFPESSIHLLENLETIIEKKLANKYTWRTCLSVVLDASKGIFSQDVKNCCSKEGISFVQFWTIFVSNLMVVVAKGKEMESTLLNPKLVSSCFSHRNIAGKCIAAIKEIIINEWSLDFTEDARLKIIESTVEVMSSLSVDTQTLSTCIQLFSNLIDKFDDEMLDKVFQSKQDVSSAGSLSYTYPPNHLSNNHSTLSYQGLATVFESLMLDSRWEVRDSSFEMVAVMVAKANNIKAIQNFLLKHPFWLESWSSLDVDEGYLRASTTRLVGIILENVELRVVLFNHISLENVTARFLSVLKEDDEAFPKRSVMDAVYRWLALDDVIDAMSCSNTGSANEAKCFATKITEVVFEMLHISSQNFDWEVKLKGIQCWARVVKACSVYLSKPEFGAAKNNGNEKSIPRMAQYSKLDQFCITSINEVPLHLLCSRNGSSILVSSINDCDQLVREAALKTLLYIKEHFLSDSVSSQKSNFDISSCLDLEDVDVIDFSNVGKFVTLIKRIDFELVAESIKLLDDQVVNNPISLLNDIIAASRSCEDNLLDCY